MFQLQTLKSTSQEKLDLLEKTIPDINSRNCYVTEQSFYKTEIIDKLDLSPEQWAIVGPLIDEELKFPKVNYMIYPLYYKSGLSASQLISYEEDNYSFLGYQARARLQINPGPCNKMDPIRNFIGLYPKDKYTQMIETQIKLWSFQYTEEYGYFVDFKVLYFNSEQQMMDYVAHPDYETDAYRPGLCAGVSHYAKADGTGHQFKIHLTDQDLDDRKLIPSQSDPASDRYNTEAKFEEYANYNKNFYAFFHNWIANTVLREVTGNSGATIVNLVMQMKIDRAEVDQFDIIMSFLIPLLVTLMYIMPLHRMIMRIVSEKQTKIREVMRMMGLSDINYWLSWFIFYTCIVTIISLVSTGILCSNVFKYSNWGLIFIFFWGFGISLFGYIIFIQSLFTNPRTASIVSILIYFFTSFADYAVNNNYLAEYRKILASILPTIAMSRAIANISVFEKAKIGLQTSNVDELYDNYKVLNCYYMFLVGLVLSFSAGIYLTNVLPTTPDGLRKVWYYPVTRKYWCGVKRQRKTNQILNDSSDIYAREEDREIESRELDRSEQKSPNQRDQDQNAPENFQSERFVSDQPQNHLRSHRSPEKINVLMEEEFESKGMNPLNYEPVDQGYAQSQESQQKILRIQNLQKTYSNGFSAVKGLNIKMYNGQIFALLGHNGAGKTTTISMLTGLVSSSAGQCEVFGYDMFDDLEGIRQFLGVCPQHDILFDLLTPEEHLDIFCDFKGVSQKDKKEQIKKMMIDTDVYPHKDIEAKYLSGGNRRKLSVAIALIGGSKLVLLDEPTAGMDLSARRKLWNMLKTYKQNRIIILTTHYMDEADILGDRIGIMTAGKLICLGSSLFLKNRFGVGYNLTMVKKSQEPNIKVGQYLVEKLGDVRKLSEISSEITFQIPTSLSYKFKEFFQYFDYDLDMLDIRSYGISVTTLEEVFLKVGHGDDTQDDKKVIDELARSRSLIEAEQMRDDYSIAEDSEKGACNLFFIHLGALYKKRLILYRRSYKSLIIEILIPVVLVMIGFGFSKIQFFINSPERNLSTSNYPYKQRLTVNSNLIKTSGNDFSPRSIMSSLPNFDSAFDVKYIDYSSIDLTTENLEKPLIVQYDTDVFAARQDSPKEPYRYGSYFIYEADKQNMQFKIATFMNISSQDVAAFYPQFIYEAIIKQASGNPNYKFEVSTRAFPVTYKQKQRTAQISGIFIVFVVSIGFSLIPAAVISFILNEKDKNLKHMQVISGMNLIAYWISNLTFDIIKSLIPCGIYELVWILFLLFPIGVIPFTYATSFFFTNENTGQTSTIFLHFFISGIGAIAAGILRLITSTYYIGDKLIWAFKAIPSYCLTESIMYQAMKTQLIEQRPELDIDDMSFNAIGGCIYILCAHGLFWTIVLIILESRIFNCVAKLYDRCMGSKVKPIDDLNLDEDVNEEEERVLLAEPNSMKVRVKQFRKVYSQLFRKPYLAVEKTSFGLEFGECFALLGVNGAGKTTTFKSLTGEIQPTNGQITINGLDIGRQFSKIRKLIGYCPQHDAIFDLMTVEEHLIYYAKIKGVKKALIQDLVEKQIQEMNLQEHRCKQAGTLSGGNKRKLSVAMCVIGNPPIILLDEPSAGMDPEARRFMWTVVAKISQQRKKSAVILTTHSMEEAEALSTKMGIMVKGGIFRCFGSSQHIKNKYGTGYEIEVKVRKLTHDDLNMKTELYGLFGTEYIQFSELEGLMRGKMIDEFLIQELQGSGLGYDIIKEAQENQGMVSVKNFLNWLYIEQAGILIIDALCDLFGEVEILDHYNDYYKFRVQKGDKSIGFVFSLIENKKESFKISEYSASQTTLEQIFQKFANQQIDNQATVIKFSKINGQLKKILASQDNVIVDEKPFIIQNQDLSNRGIKPEQ